MLALHTFECLGSFAWFLEVIFLQIPDLHG